MLRLLILNNRSPWWAAIFAWHPITILESGGMAHVDSVGVFLLLVTLLQLHQRRRIFAAICFALACGVLPACVLLFPLVARIVRWRGVAIALTMLTLIYAPLLHYQDGYMHVWRTWLAEVSEPFNGPLHARFARVAGGYFAANAIACGALVTMITIVLALRASIAVGAYWISIAAMLVSPIVHPWMLLPMLAIIPLLPAPLGWTGLIWCATVGVSYLRGPGWYAYVEYGPVFLALAIKLFLLYRRKMNGPFRDDISAGALGIA